MTSLVGKDLFKACVAGVNVIAGLYLQQTAENQQTGIFTIEKSNWENKNLYYYFSLKVFLLKEHLFKYFFFCKGTVNRTNYPLILNIIYSMDDCNNFTYEFINRLIYSENISILFLAIRRKNSFKTICLILRTSKVFAAVFDISARMIIQLCSTITAKHLRRQNTRFSG